ncbi:unnamed protein product [Sphagnum balticum]
MLSGPTALGSSAVSFDAGAVRDSQPRGLEVNCAKTPTDRPTDRPSPSSSPPAHGRCFPAEKKSLQWRRRLAGPEPDPSLRSTDGRGFGVIVSARWPGRRRKEYENKRTRFETGRLDLGFVDFASCWRGRKKMG